jgi:hypothetical protein
MAILEGPPDRMPIEPLGAQVTSSLSPQKVTKKIISPSIPLPLYILLLLYVYIIFKHNLKKKKILLPLAHGTSFPLSCVPRLE